MTKKRAKVLAFLLTLAVISSCFVTVGYGAGTKRMLEGLFGQNNVSYNGQNLTYDLDPIVMNGSTYVPLRKFANYLGKDVAWNQATLTAVISDRTDTTVTDLRTQLAIKDTDIANLNARIKTLEEQLEKKNSSGDLEDLEDDLNDDYDSFSGGSFDITLSGDEDDITVRIDCSYNSWNTELTASEQTQYLQDIVDDILDEYKDADIDGYVRNVSDGSRMYTFYVSSSGSVRSGTKSSSDLGDLEDDLNDDYDNFSGGSFDITLLGDEDEITVRIDCSSSSWNTELTASERTQYLQDIVDDILDEYEDADVDGYVRNSSSGSKMYEFYVNSNGDVREGSSGSTEDLGDLEDDLDDDYSDYFSRISLSVELEGDEDDIKYTVNIDLDDYRSEWRSLSDSSVETFMTEIYQDIRREYSDAKINGYIYDTDDDENIATYTRISDGGMTFRRLYP